MNLQPMRWCAFRAGVLVAALVGGGRIHEIEANGGVLPFGSSTGWRD